MAPPRAQAPSRWCALCVRACVLPAAPSHTDTPAQTERGAHHTPRRAAPPAPLPSATPPPQGMRCDALPQLLVQHVDASRDRPVREHNGTLSSRPPTRRRSREAWRPVHRRSARAAGLVAGTRHKKGAAAVSCARLRLGARRRRCTRHVVAQPVQYMQPRRTTQSMRTPQSSLPRSTPHTRTGQQRTLPSARKAKRK